MESDSSNLNSVVAINCAPSCFIVLTFSLIVMDIIWSSPRVSSFACDWTIFILKDCFPWVLEVECSANWGIKSQIFSPDSSSSRISCSRMEAMRTWTQCSSIIPVKIEESWVFNSEVIGSWSNETEWIGFFKIFVCVIGFTDNESIVNSCCVFSMHICQREFNTCKKVISNLEVMESYISNSFSNSSISTILPRSQVPELGCDCWILPEWISWIVRIIDNWFTWELSWLHIMENSESISTTWMGVIISESSNSFILRADVGISMRSNSMNL